MAETCATCRFQALFDGHHECRRKSPSTKGFPQIILSDFCGEHEPEVPKPVFFEEPTQKPVAVSTKSPTPKPVDTYADLRNNDIAIRICTMISAMSLVNKDVNALIRYFAEDLRTALDIIGTSRAAFVSTKEMFAGIFLAVRGGVSKQKLFNFYWTVRTQLAKGVPGDNAALSLSKYMKSKREGDTTYDSRNMLCFILNAIHAYDTDRGIQSVSNNGGVFYYPLPDLSTMIPKFGDPKVDLSAVHSHQSHQHSMQQHRFK